MPMKTVTEFSSTVLTTAARFVKSPAPVSGSAEQPAPPAEEPPAPAAAPSAGAEAAEAEAPTEGAEAAAPAEGGEAAAPPAPAPDLPAVDEEGLSAALGIS